MIALITLPVNFEGAATQAHSVVGANLSRVRWEPYRLGAAWVCRTLEIKKLVSKSKDTPVCYRG